MKMSDEEYQDESSIDDEFDEVKEDDTTKHQLSRSAGNVGKSLRRIADDNQGEIVKKSKVFDDDVQLPTGLRERARIDDLVASDVEDDNDNVEEPRHTDDVEDDEPTLMKASLRANPKDVRNQRKTEADILGIRIRLQSVLGVLQKVPEDTTIFPQYLTGATETLIEMCKMRSLILLKGPEEFRSRHPESDIPEDHDLDKIWEVIECSENFLWRQHEKVVSAWERRAHLAITRGKELRAMNKSAIEQTQAALARRAEIGSVADFAKEDSAFYQNMLRDFVQTRSATSVVSSKNSSRKKQYVERKRNKDPKISYEVHEKMVNFSTPVSFPAPPMDVDQLVKSLFKS